MESDSSSILETLRDTVCGNEKMTDFDQDIIMHANAAFTVLNQLGAGPEDGFQIIDTDEVWSDFSDNARLVNMVKTYVQMYVRLIFDPPTNSFTLESIKNLIKEYEWRINVLVDPGEGNG